MPEISGACPDIPRCVHLPASSQPKAAQLIQRDFRQLKCECFALTDLFVFQKANDRNQPISVVEDFLKFQPSNPSIILK
jgi:hypothetical protein